MELLFYSFIIAFIGGISPIVFKRLLNKIGMKLFFILNSLLFALCVIMYTLYYWEEFTTDIQTITKYDTLNVIMYTFILSFIPTIIYYNLIEKHDVHIVTAFISASPIITISLSYMLLNKKASNESVMGLILISLGIICLII